jgi:Flp pilus assembly protein TadG
MKVARDDAGSPALEFGLIAPVLVVGLLTLIDVGGIVAANGDMQSAARAGTQYFMNGGTDVSVASTLVTQAWPSKGAGQVSITAVCRCGSSAASCTATCSGGVTLSKSYSVSLSRSIAGYLITWPASVSETTQVQ